MRMEFREDPADLLAAAQQPGRFDADTAVVAEDGHFTVHLDPRWNGLGPNGGYLAAVMLRAMSVALDEPSQQPRSLTVHYQRPSAPGPARIDVEVARRGRTVASVEARLSQEGRQSVAALGAFISSGEGPAFVELAMPDMPPPESLQPYAFDSRIMPPFAACWEGRPAGALPFNGADEAMFKGWLRLVEPRPPDAFSIVAMTDALAPSLTARLSQPSHFLPTVDLTVHLPNPLPPDLPPDEHFAVQFRTGVSADGVCVEDGWIWTREGLLVAQCRQLALLVSFSPDAK